MQPPRLADHRQPVPAALDPRRASRPRSRLTRARAALAPACLALVSALVATATPALASGSETQAPERGYFRQPALADETLVFVAEGDLWLAHLDERAGSAAEKVEARRITTHPGREAWPVLSSDGARLAFTARYEGPNEVYMMPTEGGLPTRLTYEGGTGRFPPRAVAFADDGRVLISTGADSDLPEAQLALVDPRTGDRELLPLSQAADGAFDDRGRLFFQRMPFHGASHAKRYQGGSVRQLWRFDSGSGGSSNSSGSSGSGDSGDSGDSGGSATAADEAVPLTADYPGTSADPSWWDGRLYFASDRPGESDPAGSLGLWSMAGDGSDLRQHTDHVGWDAKDPVVHGGRAVYQLGADLWLHDLATGESRPLPIRLVSDFDQQRERWLHEPLEYLTSAFLSADGSRLALTARGEVFVVPVEEGRRVHVTRAPDVRYRNARFLPDDRSLLALSDASGEVEWWQLPADGLGSPIQRTGDGERLRHGAVVSPDGRWLATHDHDAELRVYALDSGSDGNGGGIGESWTVVRPEQGSLDGDYAFSPDGRWLAYSVRQANQLSRLYLHDTRSRSQVAVTSDRFRSFSPAWHPDGQWLYFLSNRHFESSVGSPWGERAPQPHFTSSTEIYALALAADARFPFRPYDELDPEPRSLSKRDRGKKAEEDSKGEGDSKAGAESKEQPPKPVEIELEGLAERLYRVPTRPGNYRALESTEHRLLWLERADGSDSAALASLAFDSVEEAVRLVGELVSYQLSANGEALLLRRGRGTETRFAVVETPGGSAKKDELEEAFDEHGIDLEGWTFPFEPREEWRQMFVDAWRLHRDYFYDRGMHGVDWQAMREKYAPLVDRVTERRELSDILAQMISELSALHASVRQGDHRSGPDDVELGFLGARLRRDPAAGGFRVERVYRVDPELPDELSPLDRPGQKVEEGSVILAIDGVETLDRPPGATLRNTVGRQVRLSVRHADGRVEPKIVEPIGARAARSLRYGAWEYERRQRVERRSQGRIGYVHLRAMGPSDIAQWQRDFYPNFTRQGLVIDVRHNTGGNIDSWILGQLLRRAWMYWQGPSGQPTWNMQQAFRGHMVVLIDSWTGSDGEAFAEGFRRLGLGPVIGQRTWGGEIWLTGSNRLVDGGVATAAEFGVYGPEGIWLIEGYGVEPDVTVDNLPHATFQGQDAQLDAALAYLEEKIREEPRPVPPPPEHPDLSSPDNRPPSEGH